jgi:hypothetical protein
MTVGPKRLLPLLLSATLVVLAASPARAVEGRFYLEAGPMLGIPVGELGHETGRTVYGFDLHFGVGIKHIPLTFGLGMHEEYISYDRWSTGSSGHYQYGDTWGVGQLCLSRSVEVRHFDTIVRLEPASC